MRSLVQNYCSLAWKGIGWGGSLLELLPSQALILYVQQFEYIWGRWWMDGSKCNLWKKFIKHPSKHTMLKLEFPCYSNRRNPAYVNNKTNSTKLKQLFPLLALKFTFVVAISVRNVASNHFIATLSLFLYIYNKQFWAMELAFKQQYHYNVEKCE